ncbi:MAG TPA: pyridoxamine 5'-phosphate oxidase [Saprospiraceae bacterium]|nr:pyridoxamine 5'-phosphate oxidase [Saprospiraceae bacterium]
MNRELADMRVNYAMKALDIVDVDPNPIVQFQIWFDEAKQAQIKEPNAMILATVDADNAPDTRTVLLKGIENNGFVFYTNYHSTKGTQLKNNDQCALTFLWLDLERQIRIKGNCNKVEQAVTDAYFQSRPRDSQIGAWTSPQSKVISSRKELEDLFIANVEKFKDIAVIPTPNFWGGYCVIPKEIEFWQGRPNRLHDRLKYQRVGDSWEIVRLAP